MRFLILTFFEFDSCFHSNKFEILTDPRERFLGIIIFLGVGVYFSDPRSELQNTFHLTFRLRSFIAFLEKYYQI